LLTDRLTLEPIVAAHASRLFVSLCAPELYRFLDVELPTSVEALEAQYRRWGVRRSPDGSQQWLNWAARKSDGEEYVGWFQATVFSNATADIAYVVFVPYQRCGYAREASEAMIAHIFDAYGVSIISVNADRRNAASIRLAQAMGFLPARSRSEGDVRLSLTVDRHRPRGTPESL
jgi:RimJ/RimL family protein N-acetyltransferase